MRGLQECLEMKKGGQAVFYPTDKSNNMAADTPENCVLAMEPHLEKHELVDEKKMHEMENIMNGHNIMFGRILKIGEDWGQQSRVKSALVNTDLAPPIVYGARKDHKATARERMLQDQTDM